ncbi:MAG: glycosyltransferase [Planctomycetes bacterium]|nr:glycosyltransferase [Planctomycetota bacterium]
MSLRTNHAKPMRICHIIATLDPAAGGPPAVALPLASAQAAAGHEVHLIYEQSPHAAENIRKFVDQTPGADRVQRHAVTDRSLAGRILAGEVCREVVRVMKMDGPCVGHLHGVWEPMLLRSAKMMRRWDCPYVVAPHGMLDPWSLSQKALKKRLALAVSGRRMLDSALFLHALNEDEQTLWAPLKLTAPVRVIANGVFIEQYQPAPQAGLFRKSHPKIGERPFFVFLSRLHYKKGLDILADAFAQFAEHDQTFDLVVAGPDGGAEADFRKRIDERGLTGRVHMTGPIYGDEKRHLLRDAAAFILPSRAEGFSIAITEALASGLPVVISQACHFGRVGDVGAGYVEPLEPAAFARAMTRLAADPAAARAMGQIGAKLVADHYTWPVIAAGLTAEYERMMAARKT